MLNLLYYSDFKIIILFILALFFVLFYEIINGFHDTANAVATIIYTRVMRSELAIIMAGIFNFLGVLFGGISVAYVVVHLLPIKLLLNINSTYGIAMIFSILLATILWNLCTWYFCLPTSSSHTLIGAIVGIGLTHSIINGLSIFNRLDLYNLKNILLSLIISPIIGLICSGILILLLRYFWSASSTNYIHMTPLELNEISTDKSPSFWTKALLIFSAIGVSYSHGANDGQKGIGLIMLILMGIFPEGFIVNLNAPFYEIKKTQIAISEMKKIYLYNHMNELRNILFRIEISNNININNNCLNYDHNNINNILEKSEMLLQHISSYKELTCIQRIELRRLLLCIANYIDKIKYSSDINKKNLYFLNELKINILNTIEYVPIWIISIVALSLSIGTMIGWKRMVDTISTKIGKTGMTYAQAMTAQLTSAISIGSASYTGIPVSTTHILSSSIAGAMLADGQGIQKKTVTNIILAWIITFPVSMILSGIFYWLILICI